MNPEETKKFSIGGNRRRITYRLHKDLRLYRFFAYFGRYPLDEFGLGYRSEKDAQEAIETSIKSFDYISPEAELDRRDREIDQGQYLTWEEVEQRLEAREVRHRRRFEEVIARHPRIVVFHGRPTIRGTRIPVLLVERSLEDEGMSYEDIQREYGLGFRDIEAALAFRQELDQAREAERSRGQP